MWDFFSYYQLIPFSIILCYLGKSITDHDLSGPPRYHLLLAPRPTEPHPTDQRSHFSLEKQTSPNINIDSYFLETLASPSEKIGMTEEVPLQKQSITFLLIIIIGGLWNIHGKQ